MKKRHGTITKVSRKNSIMSLRTMVTGGCATMIFALTSISSISAKFSHLSGSSSRSKENGLETQQVVHIQLRQPLKRKEKLIQMSKMILTTDGSTILSSEFLLLKRPTSFSV
jgi:hypothetical protein